MNVLQAKSVAIQNLLTALGHTSSRESVKAAWYFSPFRQESTPSFKVDKRANCFFDHGEGRGGNILDLAMRLFATDLNGALARMEAVCYVSSTSAYLTQPKQTLTQQPHTLDNLTISPLTNVQLRDYLWLERKINLAYAKRYIRQANFSKNGKDYFAIAFPNDKGGFELRNKYFKSSTSPKYCSFFHNFNTRTGNLNIFEGFCDFLAALTYFKTVRFAGDVIVLNSLAFAQHIALEVHGQYQRVNLFLDNDPAGQEAVKLFTGAYNQAERIYPGHKDFNDFLMRKYS